MYEKLNGYLHDPKTGFQEWMFEDAMHEYLHRYFHPLFTREVQLDEN
jgi:phage pi2 protein 07